MLTLIDNYDSFTYNLVHLFEELGTEVRVFRNDAITADEVKCKTVQLRVMADNHDPARAGRDFPHSLQQLCSTRVIEAVFVDHFRLDLELR